MYVSADLCTVTTVAKMTLRSLQSCITQLITALHSSHQLNMAGPGQGPELQVAVARKSQNEQMWSLAAPVTCHSNLLFCL